jgi:MtN3 and saliva related transmembrane protein
MTLAFVEWIGMIAAVLTTVAWLPQAIHTIQTRKTRDVSLPTQAMLFVGILLWLAYGIMLGSLPLIASNIVTIFLVGAILMIKLRNIHADSKPE